MGTACMKCARVNIFDIAAYRERLKPGQIKTAYVYADPKNEKKTRVDCMILEVYRHIAKVSYWIMVKNDFIQREVKREDTVKIKDLFIWEMYGK